MKRSTTDRLSKAARTAPRLKIAGTTTALSIALAGCIGAPTYGTGTPADKQLVNDVTGILSLAPKKKKGQVAYNPRPGIVMPASTEVLPPPQDDVAKNNPNWPESPEQRLARIRAEATENQDNPLYRSPVVRDIGTNARNDETGFVNPSVAKKQREEVLRQRAAQTQLNPTSRRYLSEPPVDYRKPLETAPVGELGEDEAKKAREAKRAAQKKGGGWSLPRLWPFGG